ncbi:MAG: hypothetical protein HZA01_14805 [Nitrospinae bacterium]|nr:hypothetical protein [Nitrospinota bacterium]
MKKTLPFLLLLFIILCHVPVLAVETAPRISDREIIENLSDLRGDIKELKAGQKALEQRFDDMNNSVNKRFDDMNNSVNKRFDILQWMLGLFITVALSIFGVMGRILWNQQKKLTQIEATLEAQKEELSFLKSLIEKLQSLIEKLLPPRGVL